MYFCDRLHAYICFLTLLLCVCVLQEDVDGDSIATFNKRQMLPSAKELGVRTLPSHGYYTLVAVGLMSCSEFCEAHFNNTLPPFSPPPPSLCHSLPLSAPSLSHSFSLTLLPLSLTPSLSLSPPPSLSLPHSLPLSPPSLSHSLSLTLSLSLLPLSHSLPLSPPSLSPLVYSTSPTCIL